MRKWIFVLFLIFLHSGTQAQKVLPIRKHPRIVVGIVVDQMRWDYLYKYQQRYGEGGFRRLLREGITCENTFIPYAQTVTAAGHACVYTGTVPAVNGILGNEWYNRSLGRQVYCTEDKEVKGIGGKGEAGAMSPANLQVTTVTDELRIATQFKSKVIGIAIKDRGAILPAGHAANAAYWFDGVSGNWISSSYYMSTLPNWVQKFNESKLVDSLLLLNWQTLYPISSYTQSDADDISYEGKFSFDEKPVFPHMTSSQAGKNYSIISSTPYGNLLTLRFAQKAIKEENLGGSDVSDFLTISLSSPDYIGHQFGPNSIEVEDNYLRLDRDLSSFFQFLDKQFGKDYTVFLTADHAVAHAPGFMNEHHLPGGLFNLYTNEAIRAVGKSYGLDNMISNVSNYQIYLNHKVIDSAKLDIRILKSKIIQVLNQLPEVHFAFDNEELGTVALPTDVKERFINGFYPKLSGDIQVILKSNYFSGAKTGTTHGSWYPYDSHIPLLFMGWGIKPGVIYREIYMSDIAPTISSLLHIQMPSGSIGKTIPEVLK